MKVKADRDEASPYAAMLAAQVNLTQFFDRIVQFNHAIVLNRMLLKSASFWVSLPCTSSSVLLVETAPRPQDLVPSLP